jgi:hypothetical protein
MKERGIFKKTVPLAMKLAERAGFKYVVSYAVNSKTRRIFGDCGMKVLVEGDLWQFEYKGAKPFVSVEEKDRYPAIVWKQIA